eukprot:SAG22_NODE_707_length_7758_cov_8.503199_5_plen_200_part_00
MAASSAWCSRWTSKVEAASTANLIAFLCIWFTDLAVAVLWLCLPLRARRVISSRTNAARDFACSGDCCVGGRFRVPRDRMVYGLFLGVLADDPDGVLSEPPLQPALPRPKQPLSSRSTPGRLLQAECAKASGKRLVAGSALGARNRWQTRPSPRSNSPRTQKEFPNKRIRSHLHKYQVFHKYVSYVPFFYTYHLRLFPW